MVTKGLLQPFYVLTDAETDADRRRFRIHALTIHIAGVKTAQQSFHQMNG